MTLDERHRVFAVSATHDTVAAAATVVPTGYRIEHMPFQVKIQRHQVAVSAVDTPLDIIRPLIALHKRYLRTGMFIVVIVMPVIESVAFVITETVVFHHIPHPLKVRDEHLLHIHIVMTPVARPIPVLSIVITACRFAVTSACVRVLVHFVILAYIRLVRMEDTVFAEIHLGEIAPTGPARAVVDHDVCYHFGARVMKRTDQRLQFRACSPVGVLIAILFRMVPRSIAVGTWRQPQIIEILSQLARLSRQCRPFGIAVFAHSGRLGIIRLVIERLHQNRLALTRYSARIYLIYIFACTAIRPVSDIQLVLLVLQLDIEVIATRYADNIFVAFAFKTGYRIGIQIYCPPGLKVRVI